jgi:hypothetical protein
MVDLSSWMWKACGGRADSEPEPASIRPLSGILREFMSAVGVAYAMLRECSFPAADEPEDSGRAQRRSDTGMPVIENVWREGDTEVSRCRT